MSEVDHHQVLRADELFRKGAFVGALEVLGLIKLKSVEDACLIGKCNAPGACNLHGKCGAGPELIAAKVLAETIIYPSDGASAMRNPGWIIGPTGAREIKHALAAAGFKIVRADAGS